VVSISGIVGALGRGLRYLSHMGFYSTRFCWARGREDAYYLSFIRSSLWPCLWPSRDRKVYICTERLIYCFSLCL